jgi:hypothetical protein
VPLASPDGTNFVAPARRGAWTLVCIGFPGVVARGRSPLDPVRRLVAPQSNVKRPAAIYIKARSYLFKDWRRSSCEAGRR